MPWLRGKRLALLLSATVIVGSSLTTIAGARAAETGHSSPLQDAELQLAEAQIEHTKAETEKAEDDDGTFWRLAPYLAPLLTALIAAFGIYQTAKKAGEDRIDAIEKEARERKAAGDAAEVVRFDERFAGAVKGLSSKSPDEQRGAAVVIASMVREKRDALSDQGLQLLLVALQSEHDDACQKTLARALGRFARAAPQRLLGLENGRPVFGLDRIQAKDLDLSRLDLPRLDIAFAVLPDVDLRETNLERSRAYGADLRDARLGRANLAGVEWVEVSAHRAKFQEVKAARARLFRADLTKANFYKADLARANFRHSTLQGARFEGARLERADFYGASFDDSALATIHQSIGWEQATFDPKTLVRLNAMK